MAVFNWKRIQALLDTSEINSKSDQNSYSLINYALKYIFPNFLPPYNAGR